MKKSLTRRPQVGIWHFANGSKVEGPPADLSGNVSGLRGDVSNIWGDVSNIWGEVSNIWGNVSGIRGDVSGLRGDIDDCDLTPAQRAAGVNVEELCAETRKQVAE